MRWTVHRQKFVHLKMIVLHYPASKSVYEKDIKLLLRPRFVAHFELKIANPRDNEVQSIIVYLIPAVRPAEKGEPPLTAVNHSHAR